MPAAAVIPAPIVYTNIVAVKKLVVDQRVRGTVGLTVRSLWLADHLSLDYTEPTPSLMPP